MKAELNSNERDKVWQYANFVKGQKSTIISQDCLGSEIHKEDYGKTTLYGWVAEYIISPAELREMDIDDKNALCEANIRILQIDNYHKNSGHRRGHYVVHPYDECTKHWHIVTFSSNITEEGLSELQRLFGLKDEQMKNLFTK